MRLIDYIIRRIFLIIPVLIGVSLITFTLSHVIPGDPARLYAGEQAKPEQVEQVRKNLRLDKPTHIQYYYYMKGLIHGDLGNSISEGGRPVSEAIKGYFPATFELTLISMFLCLIMGIPLGVLSATKKDKTTDHITRVIALSGVSMPIFWLGLLLQLLFFYKMGWLPATGRIGDFVTPPKHITGLYIIDSILTRNRIAFVSSVKHILMPAFCLSYHSMGIILRMTRSSMLEVSRQDYIRTARAKGLSERSVVYKHTLRNALIPTTTVAGLAFGGLLGGAVLTETIFAWPGMGRYAVTAIMSLDYPAIMGFALLMAVIYTLANLIVDILYAVLDPRIRYG